MEMTPEDYSRAYNNRLRVPDFMDVIRLWEQRSAQARASLKRAHWDLPYGPHLLNTLDVIEPAAQGRHTKGAPILFFIHGGYWRMLDKSAQTFIAPHWSRRGAMVVIPNYRLAPSVALSDICLDIAQALAWVWRHARDFGGDPSRIVVAGHSAGGHLTGMALSCRWPEWSADLPPDMARKGLAISGIFDMTPLQHCEWLMPDIRLTPSSIPRLSPAAWPAPPGRHLVAVCGALESSEFHRQNQLIHSAWGPAAVHCPPAIEGRHHFDILLDLEDPASRLSNLLGGQLGL